MSAKTKPLGTGTANLSVNMPITLKQALERLARESDMGVGPYCRRCKFCRVSRSPSD